MVKTKSKVNVGPSSLETLSCARNIFRAHLKICAREMCGAYLGNKEFFRARFTKFPVWMLGNKEHEIETFTKVV